ncbi:MAG: hypothetical protein MUE69_15515 [Myxococcota bacterium]|nr:hypothetical protein [Myxococcota bacterium]
MRPFLVTLLLGVVLLPGAQHGVADLIDPQHGMHGHCHHAYEAHPDEAHDHEGHAHADEHAHEGHAHADEHDADEHDAHEHDAHEGRAHADHSVATHDDVDAHVRIVLPLPCSTPDHDAPCPHAPLEGGHHHSHAMPPMLITSPPSALAVWSAPRHLAYGVRALHLHGRASPRSLDRPPRA